MWIPPDALEQAVPQGLQEPDRLSERQHSEIYERSVSLEQRQQRQ
jgi:hypothetical protein